MTIQYHFLKRILVLSCLILTSHLSVADTSNLNANYDSTSKLLYLPVVSIDNSSYLQLNLELISPNPALLQLKETQLLENPQYVSATYDGSTGMLSVPAFFIDDQMYSAELLRNNTRPEYQFDLFSFTNLTNFRLVDTAQVTCYDSKGSNITCDNSGQDGAYSGNQPSYTNNNDGTSTDNITALVWQNSPDTNNDGTIDSSDKLSQSAAESYCTNLNLSNQSDWRLPNIQAMYSLINFSGEDVSSYSGDDTNSLMPFIDTDYFSFAYGDTAVGERIIDVQYATSTLYVSKTMNIDDTMFGVNMADGRIKGYGISIGNTEKNFTVQCVRGNESYGENNFINNNNQTITDTASGLIWEKNDSQLAMDWDAAISYCEENTTASFSDWRLPNAKELQSIIDYNSSPDTSNSAAINAIFNATSFTNEAGETDWGFYWTGTTHKNTSGIGDNAVYIAFGRALGYMNGEWMDVHGAGAQRSDPKSNSIQLNNSYVSITDVNGNDAIYHGPQGDVVRINNYVRCVR
jgi:hypothetical protein